MKNLTLHTPEGVRDIYNSEYERRLEALIKLRRGFKDYGYMPIMTPTFEYFDTFSKEVGSCKSNEMFKFFDREGNTLVLRPDITPSVARAAAMYFSDTDGPVKLSYEGNVFINYHSLQGRLKESTQAGCEFIGDSSVDADAEILTIVVNALKDLGLKEFEIGVGHIDVVRGLIDACNLSESEEDKLIKLISNKNFFGAKELLESAGVNKSLVELFELTGKILNSPKEWSNYLEKAKKYKKVYDALEYLTKLYELLKKNGVMDYISFELGMISEYKYYTGIIFTGYSYGIGEPLVKGGRYDSLLSHFGKDSPAIGFAITVDQLMLALERQTKG
ncbi:MAG: ATP phosphoribosyltransferase regulatory subunit [Pseudobutyrivibrio sp.]|nr:ATP phosphoribosyltransferase regulatory subunit [Pseudobutyrivibrio sp.]